MGTKINSIYQLVCKETAILEALRIYKVLYDNGVNLENIQLSKLIEGEQKVILLKDIEGIEDILKQQKLPDKLPIEIKIRDVKLSEREVDKKCLLKQQEVAKELRDEAIQAINEKKERK